MNEDFVPYELAVKLKKKGFDEVCYNYYEPLKHCLNQIKTPWTNKEGESYGVITAPTISQVLKWLREEKKIHFEFVAAAYGYNGIISQTPDAGGTDYYYTHMNDDGPNDGGAWDRYEDAALYCVEYAIDNLI